MTLTGYITSTKVDWIKLTLILQTLFFVSPYKYLRLQILY
mgnify:CR=1 FL=1